MTGRPARLVLTLVLGITAMAMNAAPARAHAGLEASDPANGAVLDRPPSKVTVAFTEPPDPDLSEMLVLNAGGQEVQTGPAQLGSAPRSLVVPLPADLADGIYTVSWSVVSTADGHLTSNSFAFGVGVDPGPVTTESTDRASTPAPSPASVWGRALLYLGILFAIGVALAGLWTIGPSLPGRRGLASAAGGFAVAGAVVMLFAERAILGVSMSALLSSSTGRAYVWLLAAAGLTLVGSLTVVATSTRWSFVLMGLAGIATAAVRSTGGHAAAASPALPQELAQTAHMVAAGIWIGGFVPILALARSRTRGGAPAPVAEVRRFSTAAGWAVLVVVATGLTRVVSEAGGLGSVWAMLSDTTYGTTLIVKVAIVAVVIALGAWNRLRSIPRLADGDRMLGRVMTAEAVGAIVIVLTTGLLTGLNPEPPRSSPPVTPSSISASGSDFATTVRVELTVAPGLAGPNDFRADVTDFDSGEPVVATGVTLRFEPLGRAQVPASELDLDPSGSGAWTGSGPQLSLAGVWEVTATVQTGARATDVPLVLTTRPPGELTTDVATTQDGRDIVTLTLAGGLQLQCYFDPGTAGPNDLHVTTFDAEGLELPLDDILVVLTPDGQSPRALSAERLAEGHFSAPVETDVGRYRVDVVATAEDGSILQGWFTQDIADDA